MEWYFLHRGLQVLHSIFMVFKVLFCFTFQHPTSIKITAIIPGSPGGTSGIFDFSFLFSILSTYHYFFIWNSLCFYLLYLPHHHCLNVLLRATVSLFPLAESPMSFLWLKTSHDFLLLSIMNTNLFAYSFTGCFYSYYLTLFFLIPRTTVNLLSPFLPPKSILFLICCLCSFFHYTQIHRKPGILSLLHPEY